MRIRPSVTTDERGMALPAVVIVIVIVSLLVVTSLSYATSSQGLSRRNQDWNAALPAAEAGVDDYLTRLNQDESYSDYDSSTNPDYTNDAFVDSSEAVAGFASLPGAATGARFRYEVDTSALNDTGVIEITSVGEVNGVEREVRTSLRKKGFIDYLYFTDLESQDPALYDSELKTYMANRGLSPTACAKYFYDPSRPSLCESNDTIRRGVSIQFAEDDVIAGPAHSNDAMRMAAGPNGPRFLGNLTTTYATGERWLRGDGSPGTGSPRPRFHRPNDPEWMEKDAIPETNEALRQDAIEGGCLFTGPTRIRLLATGKMAVRSPFTSDTNPGETQKCFSGSLATEVQMDLPRNGVVYVQNVPASGANSRSGCGGNTRPVGYPQSGDVTPYDCLDGDAFIEGTLDGRLTVGAANDVVITWHLTYKDGLTGPAANDMLGLVANNNVAVYHPVDRYGRNLDVRSSGIFRDPVIQAAILSLKHSFTVQNHDEGETYRRPLGTLTVDGSISQKFRGPVGMGGGTGYLKNYRYDARMKLHGPPRFLSPEDAPWGVVRWEER